MGGRMTIRDDDTLAKHPAQRQNPIEPIEFLSGFLTERLAIERGIEWSQAIHDLCNRAIEEEKLAEQPAQVDPCIDGSCSCCWSHLDEQPAQQEPVSGVVIREGLPTLLQDRNIKPTDSRLYTSPQPSKPWVGLTEEQKAELVFELFNDGKAASKAMYLLTAHEAKLREKNA